MPKDPGALAVGIAMGVFGLAGLLLAAGAHDNEMYVFGFSLAGFAAVFIFGMVKSVFDHKDAALVKVRSDDHG